VPEFGPRGPNGSHSSPSGSPLKIRWPQGRGSSSLPPGTLEHQQLSSSPRPPSPRVNGPIVHELPMNCGRQVWRSRSTLPLVGPQRIRYLPGARNPSSHRHLERRADSPGVTPGGPDSRCTVRAIRARTGTPGGNGQPARGRSRGRSGRGSCTARRTAGSRVAARTAAGSRLRRVQHACRPRSTAPSGPASRAPLRHDCASRVGARCGGTARVDLRGRRG
jgi:hypothetical protein